MVQDLFRKLIDDVYVEWFKSIGWKKQGTNYRFFDDSGLGKIINFQKSKWSDDNNIEFFINYGLYFETDDCILNKSFKEYNCQFRNRTKLNNGIYCLNEKSNYEELKSSVIKALQEADSLFKEIDSKQIFISKIINGSLQKETDTPIMNYYTCKLLSDSGYYEEIYEYVKSRGGEFFYSLTTEIEMKMKS